MKNLVKFIKIVIIALNFMGYGFFWLVFVYRCISTSQSQSQCSFYSLWASLRTLDFVSFCLVPQMDLPGELDIFKSYAFRMSRVL